MPWTYRRSQLENLAIDWRPPLQLCPYMSDREKLGAGLPTTGLSASRVWWSKGQRIDFGRLDPYPPGRRGWIKVKSRESRDIVVGAVIGTIQHLEVIIAGRYSREPRGGG